MNKIKTISRLNLCTVIIFLFLITGCSAQNSLNLDEEISKEIIDLNRKVENLNTKNEDLKNQLGTSLTIYQNSNNSISNQLGTMSLIIALSAIGLGVVGLLLGVYINRKEKNIKEILEKSEEYLKEQKRIQKDIELEVNETLKQTNELKDSINTNLKSLYIKLKDEELNEILEIIDENPSTIHNHISRLISLNIDNKYYDLFISRLFHWHNEQTDSEAISDLLIFLLGRFSNKLLDNQAIRPIIIFYWSRITRFLPFTTIKFTLHYYLDNYFLNAHAGIENDTKVIIQAISSDYNHEYIAKELLFNHYKNKEQRFKLYNFLKSNEIWMVFHIYKYLLQSEYQGSNNTVEHQAIIDEIK